MLGIYILKNQTNGWHDVYLSLAISFKEDWTKHVSTKGTAFCVVHRVLPCAGSSRRLHPNLTLFLYHRHINRNQTKPQLMVSSAIYTSNRLSLSFSPIFFSSQVCNNNGFLPFDLLSYHLCPSFCRHVTWVNMYCVYINMESIEKRKLLLNCDSFGNGFRIVSFLFEWSIQSNSNSNTNA